MSGIESLIDKSVQAGMQMASQAFSQGGQVQSYAGGGPVRNFAIGGYTDYEDWNWDLWGDYTDGATPEVTINTTPPPPPPPEPYTGPAVADPDTAFTSPMATTQPVASTGAVSGTTSQDWYDLGLDVSGGGNMQVPSIRKSDFAYYEAQGEPTMQVTMGGGDSGTWTETVANPNYRPAGYYMTPEAQERLGEQWTKDNNTSIAWGGNADTGSMLGGDSMGDSFSSYWRYTGGAEGAPTGLQTRPIYGPNDEITGYETGYYSGNGDNPEWIPWTPTEVSREELDAGFEDWWNGLSSGVTANVKTAGTEGTPVYWTMQGDELVPVQLGSEFEVHTNNDWTVPAIAFGSLAAAAYLAPAAAAEAGAAAGTAGTSAAEAFALSDAVYGAANLGYTAADLAALGGTAALPGAGQTLTSWGVLDTSLALPGTTIIDGATGATLGTIGAGGELIGPQLANPELFDPYANLFDTSGVTSLDGIAGLGELPPEMLGGVDMLGAYGGVPELSALGSEAWLAGNSIAGGTIPESVPFEEGFTPSEANPVSGPEPWSIPPAAQKVIDWAIEHPGAVMTGIGVVGGLLEDPDDGSGGGVSAAGGWNQPINQRAMGRSYTPAPEGYRPGFSPEHQYVNYMMADQAPPAGIGGAPPPDIPPLPPPDFAAGGSVNGGIARLNPPRHTKGPGDGMSDSIPATIEGRQRAALSKDEFVIPADVVSHLGNGSSEAGAQILYAMMDRIRQARTGNPKQARQIDPRKFLPA